MNSKLDRKIPGVGDIEKAALRRLPGFVADYIRCGMGKSGADHIIELLIDELRCTMGQLGCAGIGELPDRLMD